MAVDVIERTGEVILCVNLDFIFKWHTVEVKHVLLQDLLCLDILVCMHVEGYVKLTQLRVKFFTLKF